MVKLSIIVPVYNVEQYLEKCLQSCMSQDLPQDEYEIIVVNDGSPDGSLNIAERIASTATNMTIISQENGGLSAARNTGMSVAKGEYIWFVDSDDWIETNCLKQLTDTLYNEQLDALVINGVRVINGIERKNPPRAYTDKIISGKEYLKGTIVNCAAVITIYKRELLCKNNLEFKNGIFHEDAEFTPRAYYFVKRIEIKNYHFYYNLLNPTSITQNANPKKGFDLIEVACSLYKFQHGIQGEDNSYYNKYIASALNQALNNAIIMDKDNKKLFIENICKHQYLFNALINTNSIIYKLEGLLFKLFPKRCISIYKSLKKIKG